MHARVKDIMTTRVMAVRSDASYRDMIAALRARRVSGLPVVDAEGTVVGVVSETDLLTKRATAAPTAADLMTRPVVTTSPDELVSSVARLMSRRKLRRVPVVDRGDTWSASSAGQTCSACSAGRMTTSVARSPRT